MRTLRHTPQSQQTSESRAHIAPPTQMSFLHTRTRERERERERERAQDPKASRPADTQEGSIADARVQCEGVNRHGVRCGLRAKAGPRASPWAIPGNSCKSGLLPGLPRKIVGKSLGYTRASPGTNPWGTPKHLPGHFPGIHARTCFWPFTLRISHTYSGITLGFSRGFA